MLAAPFPPQTQTPTIPSREFVRQQLLAGKFAEVDGLLSSELPFFREGVQQKSDLSYTLDTLLEELPLLITLDAETRVLG